MKLLTPNPQTLNPYTPHAKGTLGFLDNLVSGGEKSEDVIDIEIEGGAGPSGDGIEYGANAVGTAIMASAETTKVRQRNRPQVVEEGSAGAGALALAAELPLAAPVDSGDRLLKEMDNLSYRCLGAGFALLTAGLISGAVWANEAWGSYWSWDPKETW